MCRIQRCLHEILHTLGFKFGFGRALSELDGVVSRGSFQLSLPWIPLVAGADKEVLARRRGMKKGVWWFATPTRQRDIEHTKNYYGRMLLGEELFHAFDVPIFSVFR